MIDDTLFDDDKLHEECGVFGIYGHEDAANLTYLGLYALQHRGQESTGIVASDGETLRRHTGMGLVKNVFSNQKIFERLEGPYAIGHNRYSTTGGSNLVNTQPVLIDYKAGQLASAHNGNLVNAASLRDEMEHEGSIFTSTTDTEVIMHLVARSKAETVEGRILESLKDVSGAFSILFLTPDTMYAARDPRGVRPLCLGKLDDGYVISSETCALDLVRAEYIRDIEPGEMIKIDKSGITSMRIPLSENFTKAHCVFEHIYFSRPDSAIFGDSVDEIRRAFGSQLAVEHDVPNADFVMGVPDSATTAALGYAEGSGLPYQMGLIRNHYVGRTFILPEQGKRDFGVRIKFNPINSILKDKTVVIVDDSIVRGTTMKKIMQLVRAAGPKAIHLRISSPPVLWPCFYGIDMPKKEQFIAHNNSIEEIRKYLEVDSLGYLSIDGIKKVLPEEKRNDFCMACFNGDYPISVENATDEDRFCH